MQNRLADEVQPNRLSSAASTTSPSDAPQRGTTGQGVGHVGGDYRARGRAGRRRAQSSADRAVSRPPPVERAPAPQSRLRSGDRWLLAVFLLAFVASVVGSVVVPALAGDPELGSYYWLLSAPIGGLVGGLAAGLVAGLRRVALSGFLLAFAGCVVAQLIAWLVAGGDGAALPLFLAFGCVPFVVGYGLGALAGAAWRGDRRADKAVEGIVDGFIRTGR